MDCARAALDECSAGIDLAVRGPKIDRAVDRQVLCVDQRERIVVRGKASEKFVMAFCAKRIVDPADRPP